METFAGAIGGGYVELPSGIKLTGIKLIGSPDTNLVTEIKLFPINTRFTSNDSRVYRYIVDEKGYRWIGEELWLRR